MATSAARAAIPLIWLLLLSIVCFNLSSCGADTHVVCSQKEKQALLHFKQGLNPSGRLSSWTVEQDCCSWMGVRCDNLTGRVIELHLANPPTINETLEYWNLSRLGGMISPALLELEFLSYLNLSYNDFGGTPIPSFLGSMKSLKHLDLNDASFGGLIPHQLGNLSGILYLNLGWNDGIYVDNLGWVAHLHTLEFLVLSGVNLQNQSAWIQVEELELVTKGVDLEYSSVLQYVRSIDLSSNFLSGPIPGEISTLVRLHFLNLSHNQLVGELPENLGNMVMLESLDLSGNRLSGEIPESMTRLTFLQVLDLSCNNLWGKIPTSTQLQSFNETCFMGNAGLCGLPLSKSCTDGEESQGGISVDDVVHESEIQWFYKGIGPGFATGFSGVCASLLFNRTWRHAYFLFLDNVKDWIYVTVVIKMKWVRGMLKRLASVD